MRYVAFTVLLLAQLNSSAQFLVDGFQQPKQSAIVGVSSGINSWSSFYSDQGEVGLQKKTWISSLYVSVNPIASLRIAANIPYFQVIDKNVKKYQDIFIQAQWMPISLNGFTPFLLFGYGEPLAEYRTEIGNAIGQQAVVRAYGFGTQYTQSNWFASFMFQHQSKNFPVPDANQWQLRSGYYKGNWFGAIRIDHQTSIGGSDYRDGTNRPFTNLGAGYTKISLDMYQRLTKNIGLSASVGQTLNGRNVGKAFEFFLGVIWNGRRQGSSAIN